MTPGTATRREHSPWIQSARWDAVWMFSGLWAPALLLLGFGALTLVPGLELSFEALPHRQDQLIVLLISLGILHRLSSIYAVLFTPILRDSIRDNPRRFLHVPAWIATGCLLLALAFVYHPMYSFMPGGRRGQLWAYFVLATVFLLWDRWHFCAQEFGVLSIYRNRAGQRDRADRRFDRFYTVLLMLGVNSFLFMAPGQDSQRHILFYGTWLEDYRPEFWDAAFDACLAIGLVAMGVAVYREWTHPKRSLPKLLFYVLVGSHTVLLYLFPSALSLFFFGYVVHHWMVAVGLFNRIMLGSYAQAGAPRPAMRYLTRVGPVLFACVLYYFFLAPFDVPGHLTPVPNELAFVVVPPAMKPLFAMAIASFFAFNFLHYYYDRILYNFAHPGVRRQVVPLLLDRT